MKNSFAFLKSGRLVLLSLILILIIVLSATVYAILQRMGGSSQQAACNNSASNISKGVVWHWNTNFLEQDAQDMQNAGINWARVQMQQNTGDYTIYDTLVQIAQQHCINLLPNIRSIPSTNLGTQTQRDAYKAWLARTVNRYKNSIHYWEIGNEPDLPQFWNIDIHPNSDQAQYDDAVDRYIQHLKDSYITIHSVDSSAKVLIGGVSEFRAERYLDSLIKNHGYLYFDIMAFHPYQSTPVGVISRVDSLKSKMAQVPEFAAKPIWITEIGWNTFIPHFPGELVPDEQAKAMYLSEVMPLLKNDGVSLPIFWYDLHEIGNIAGHGLTIRTSATQVEYLSAYYAYKNLWTGQSTGTIQPEQQISFTLPAMTSSVWNRRVWKLISCIAAHE